MNNSSGHIRIVRQQPPLTLPIVSAKKKTVHKKRKSVARLRFEAAQPATAAQQLYANSLGIILPYGCDRGRAAKTIEIAKSLGYSVANPMCDPLIRNLP